MRKLMWFSIGFSASCVIAMYFISGGLLALLALIFGILSVVALLFRQRVLKIIGTVLLGFSIGVAWMWCYDTFYLQPARAYDGQMQLALIEASDYSYATDYGAVVDGRIHLGNRQYKIRVYFDETRQVKPGDRLSGVITLGMTTPSGTEESDYYQSKGIFLLAQPEGGMLIEPVAKIPSRYFPAVLRKEITDILNNTFPKDVLGFVRALLLGDSSLLTYEEDTAFKVSGIRHIIAVSGLHVSILFSLIYTVAFRRRVSTALLGIPVLLLFAAVAGFTPSITRACIMQILMILALLLDQEYDPPTALAFAVLVILAVNPMTVTSASFQLSVGCVIGIFVFGGRVSNYILNKLGRPTGNSKRAKLARWVSTGAGITLSAMVFTTPLTAAYFGTISLVSVFTNLLTLWAVSIVFYGIMLTCLLGWIWLPLGKLVAWIISWLARYILLTAKLFAAIPLAAVYTESVYIVIWIAFCYLLFAVFLILKKKRPVALLATMAACLCISLAASYLEPRADGVRITVFDVGEGQSILIQSKDKYYLVDCGGSSDDKTAEIVTQSLLAQGVFRLDGLILTHYDDDHTGAVPGLLYQVRVESLYLPDIADSGNMKEYLSDEYPKNICWIKDTHCFDQGENKLTVIAAPSNSTDENESSLCVLFQAENYDILITGDRGVAGERALVENYDLPQLELLVAGHHGSANSTNFELLSETMPKSVVISSGDKYGHPALDLLSRLKSFGCEIWRTDQHGTIVFRG